MKVMISQPMKGLSVEQIKKNREEVVKKLERIGLEVVDTVIAETPPKSSHEALWFLAKSLEIMSQCDIVYFMRGWQENRGCMIEYSCAHNYGLVTMHEN